MKRCVAPLLSVAGALVMAGCESVSPPVVPTPLGPSPGVSPQVVTEETTGPATLLRQPSDGPVAIQHGILDLSHASGEIRLKGSRGFSLTATVTRSGGIVSAIDACFNSNCAPHTAIPLRAFWSGNDLRATVTLDGETYAKVGGLAGGSPAAFVEFSGSALAPLLTRRGMDQITATFDMEGAFSYTGGIVPFTGAGVVKLWLAHVEGSPGWSVERLVYRFKHQH